MARLKLTAQVSNDAELAVLLGVSSGAISNAKNRGHIPRPWFQKISRMFNVDAAWLITGQSGDISDPAMQNNKTYRVYDEAGVEIIEAECTDLVLIPLVEAKLSAGNGSFETSDKSDRKYSFRRDFLQRKGCIREMVLMRVTGDSMAPEIKDGDVVLLDKSQSKPLPGRIYAVGVENMVYLKRVDARPGKLVLYSDNKDYDPIEVDTRGDMAGQARIIGRAIWWCREA